MAQFKIQGSVGWRRVFKLKKRWDEYNRMDGKKVRKEGRRVPEPIHYYPALLPQLTTLRHSLDLISSPSCFKHPTRKVEAIFFCS
jgi:hypothetical protein